MSVIMTMQFDGDPATVERYVAEHPDEMQAILDNAVQHGEPPQIVPMLAVAGISGDPSRCSGRSSRRTTITAGSREAVRLHAHPGRPTDL
jgi:hypothetical protein